MLQFKYTKGIEITNVFILFSLDCTSTLPTIVNGNGVLDVPTVTTFGSTATVTCDDGYIANPAQINCKADGNAVGDNSSYL